MYTRVWTDAVLGTNPANTIDTLLANIRGDINERLTDLFTLTSFIADPLVATAIKMNRTAHSKILGGTTDFSIRKSDDSVDNVLVGDAFGDVTIRGTLTAPSFFGNVNASQLTIADSTLANYIVSVGAVDSGGAGYRLLRVGNAFVP